MIGPLIGIIEATVIAGGLALSNGIDRSNARRRAAAPRQTIRYTPQASVDRLVAAFRDLRDRHSALESRAARLEAENRELREQLAAASRIFQRTAIRG